MIALSTALWICFGFIIYYSVFQVFSDFVRSGMTTNSPNKTISELRTEYRVNIRTFQKNNSLRGFCWFKSIFINENLFRNKGRLMFTFHHEMYHLKHNHKAWVLVMRFVFSLLPILLSFVYYWVFLLVFIASAGLIQYLSNRFEDSADSYAKEMIDEGIDEKRKKSNR